MEWGLGSGQGLEWGLGSGQGLEGAAGMRACCLWSAIGVAMRSAMSRSTLYPACTCEGERERVGEGGRGWEALPSRRP